MTWWMILAIVIGCIWAYTFLAAFLHPWLTEVAGETRGRSSGPWGMLWPVMLPVAAGFWATEQLSDRKTKLAEARVVRGA